MGDIVAMNWMGAERFERNGIEFVIPHAPTASGWQLYYLNEEAGCWETLSIWASRAEAVEAAECFIPKGRWLGK